MASALRNTAIEPVGERPWGTHFCHFYQTGDELLETLVPFFKAGLESNEFCAWVVSEPLTESGVWQALDRAVPRLDRYVSDNSIEILKARDVYLAGGNIDLHRIIGNWSGKLQGALSRGYQGLRASGNTAWLAPTQWADFMEYEAQLNRDVSNQPMLVLCTYPLTTTGAIDDVTRTHQLAVAKREFLLRPAHPRSRMQRLRGAITRAIAGFAEYVQHAPCAERCSQCGRFGAGARFRWCVGGHKLHQTCVKYEMGREACPICGISVSEFPT